MSEWISVKDRLPESDTDVLLYAVDDMIFVGYISCLDKNFYTLTAWSYDHIDTEDVLFWMPLPEPPKDGGVK